MDMHYKPLSFHHKYMYIQIVNLYVTVYMQIENVHSVHIFSIQCVYYICSFGMHSICHWKCIAGLSHFSFVASAPPFILPLACKGVF